jgi:hypothetical protein
MPHCLEVSGDSSFPASQVERPSTLRRHQREEQLTMELRVAVVVGGARPGHELRCMVFPGGSEIGPFETSADQWAVGRLHGAAL